MQYVSRVSSSGKHQVVFLLFFFFLLVMINKKKICSRTEGKRPRIYCRSRREKWGKDCEGNSRGNLDHTVVQHWAQQDKVSESLYLPSSTAPRARCWYLSSSDFIFPLEVLVGRGRWEDTPCDLRAPDVEVRDGLELGDTLTLPTSNGVVAALIASEQLQQVKHTYLTRCLLAGLSTLASIN